MKTELNKEFLLSKMPVFVRNEISAVLTNLDLNEHNPIIIERILNNSHRINWDAYLKKYDDVAQSGYNPMLHYMFHGWKEGRELSILVEEQSEDEQDRPQVLSCKQLRGGLVYEGGALYACCAVNCGKRPFLAKVNEDGTFDIQKVIAARKQIEKELNTTGANPVCNGCPLLEKLPESLPSDKETYYVCHGFNIGESHHCNFRCIYCAFNKVHLCSEPRRVTMTPIIKFLLKHDMLAKDAYVSVAGGEPLLMPDFDDALALLLEPGQTAITLNTNLSVWSDAVAKVLNSGRVLIRTSIDAGTPETFARIKGRDLFWKVVENAWRYANINPDQVLLKYICMRENSNDKDMLGLLNILNANMSQVLIDFDYYTPPDKNILRFAGEFRALAGIVGIDAQVRFEAEHNWPKPIQLRKKLDAYALLYLSSMFKLSRPKSLELNEAAANGSCLRGWVDLCKYDDAAGLSVKGWAWDHEAGPPKAIRVYNGNRLLFSGKTNYIRLDIEASAKAGFDFSWSQNPVLKNIMAHERGLAVYATFDGIRWDKLQMAPGAMQF